MISKRIIDVLDSEVHSAIEAAAVISHLVSKFSRARPKTGRARTVKISCSVRILLQQCITQEEIKRKNIAKKLCMSERNLVRKLKDEGVSYRQLVDEMRKLRCIALMQQNVTDSNILADQLCFSDGSYIYRVFQRWTGMSFSQARAIVAQDPNKVVSIFYSEESRFVLKEEVGGRIMRQLTIEETQKVSGGVGPAGAVVGALTGAAGYLGAAVTSGQFSWRGLAYNTGAGAVLGAIAGPVGAVQAYLLPRAAFAMGAAYGLGV